MYNNARSEMNQETAKQQGLTRNGRNFLLTVATIAPPIECGTQCNNNIIFPFITFPVI